jgi:hypothetical protein
VNRGDREDGFTLIEILIASTLTFILIAVFATGFILTVRMSTATTNRFSESHDAQLSSTYFGYDVQSTTGVNTGSVASCAPSSGVTAPHTLINFTLPGATESSTYYYGMSGTEREIRRAHCLSGSTTDTTITHLTNTAAASVPTVACVPAYQCPTTGAGLPTSVSISVIESPESQFDTATPFSWSVSAARRPTVGTTPSLGLLTLGSTGTDVSVGTNTLTASGPIYVNSNSAGAMSVGGGGKLQDSGGAQIVAGGTCSSCTAANTTILPTPRSTSVTDPLAQMSPPDESKDCNPAVPGPCAVISTGVYSGPGVYTTQLTMPNPAIPLASGTYILHAGIKVTGGSLTTAPGGVLLFIGCGLNAASGCTATGNVSIASCVAVNASPLSSGAFAGIFVLQSSDDTNSVSILNGSTINGLIYAPAADVTLGSGGAAQLTIPSVIAKTVTVSTGKVTLGP